MYKNLRKIWKKLRVNLLINFRNFGENIKKYFNKFGINFSLDVSKF